ncbi:acetyltransferase [Alistipes sp.]|uniref:acetyltransferase n=1 Tax=Alistipes sp. TaxID=1872444 RepID=UPI0025C59FEE|nr:acetyltransferase [Alistipes sp.]
MYLYGASGHAKVIIDILKSQGVEVNGCIDDDPSKDRLAGYEVLHDADGCDPLIVSIGDNAIRKSIANRLTGHVFGTGVHVSAVVSPSSRIAEGTVVMPGAIVQADAVIGRHCIINTGATVDHECTIGDYVHISPNASLCGNVSVGEGTQIGAGSVVVPGVRIGRWSLICAGSVVTRDIPDYCIAAGNRCKVIKTMNKECCIPDFEGGGILNPE